jgi:hypothetical protein
MAVASSGVMRPSTAPGGDVSEDLLTFERYSMRSQASDTAWASVRECTPSDAADQGALLSSKLTVTTIATTSNGLGMRSCARARGGNG